MYKFQVGDMVQFSGEGKDYLRSDMRELNKEYDMENSLYIIIEVGHDSEYPYKIKHPSSYYNDVLVFTEDELELYVESKGQQKLPFKDFRKVRYETNRITVKF